MTIDEILSHLSDANVVQRAISSLCGMIQYVCVRSLERWKRVCATVNYM